MINSDVGLFLFKALSFTMVKTLGNIEIIQTQALLKKVTQHIVWMRLPLSLKPAIKPHLYPKRANRLEIPTQTECALLNAVTTRPAGLIAHLKRVMVWFDDQKLAPYVRATCGYMLALHK